VLQYILSSVLGPQAVQEFIDEHRAVCNSLTSLLEIQSELVDIYLSGGLDTRGRVEKFKEWLCRFYGEAMVSSFPQVGDGLIEWIEFSFLGCVRDTTPATWVLAATSVPYTMERVNFVSQHLNGKVTVFSWLDLLNTLGVQQFYDWLDKDVLAKEEKSIVVERVLKWVVYVHADVFPCLEWYRDRRDACFHDIVDWLRGFGGVGRVSSTPFGRFKNIRSLTAGALLKFEREELMGTPLTLDARRILMEVGDVGTVLFGMDLVRSGEFSPGPWLWESAVFIPDDRRDQIVRMFR
jgi:hypothetical protein